MSSNLHDISPIFFAFFSYSNFYLQWIKDEIHTERLVIVSTVLTFVFVVEVVMKNIAFTPRGYWQSRRNRYDLLVTVAGVVWIFLQIILSVGIFLLKLTILIQSICQSSSSNFHPRVSPFTKLLLQRPLSILYPHHSLVSLFPHTLDFNSFHQSKFPLLVFPARRRTLNYY